MEGDTENCTTCGPNGLKFSRHNGRGRVEVPQDFLADKLGSIDQQIAEGMAMAERLAAARQTRDAAPATRPSQSYQPPEPSAPTRPAGNFTFDALTMTAETQQGAPSGESRRPRGNQFTLAETEHASLLGIGPPPGPPTTNQFNIAESGAADVCGLGLSSGARSERRPRSMPLHRLLSYGAGIPDLPDLISLVLDVEPSDMTDEEREAWLEMLKAMQDQLAEEQRKRQAEIEAQALRERLARRTEDEIAYDEAVRRRAEALVRALIDKHECLERAREDWDRCREKAGKTLTGCAFVCAGFGLASGGTALNICLAACILNYALERQKCDDDYDTAKKRCEEDYEKAKKRAIEDNPIPPKPASHDY